MKHPLLIFIGQCGCQVGSHLIDTLSGEPVHPFLSHEGKVAAIFVDIEHKVINVLKKIPAFQRLVERENVIFKRGCNAGSWAKGFHSPDMIERVMQAVRRKVNKHISGMYICIFVFVFMLSVILYLIRPIYLL